MMKRLLLLSLIICFGISQFARASVDIRPTFYTINEGLADNLVRRIFQDSKGFLWISTQNGLNRYDGYSFMTFLPEKGDPVSLADRHVLDITEDKHGFLWAKTSPGYYSCYDLRQSCFVDFTGCGAYKEKYTSLWQADNGDTWLWQEKNGCRKVTYKEGRFSSVTFPGLKEMLSGGKINQLLEDGQGVIWLCTESGLIRIKNDRPEQLLKGTVVLSAVCYQNRIFLLTGQGTILSLDPNGGESRLVLHVNEKDSLLAVTSTFRFQDHWVILTPQTNYIFHLPGQHLMADSVFDLPNAHPFFDNAGNLWLYDRYGRLRYVDAQTGKKKDFPIVTSDQLLYDNSNWFFALQDSRGLLWISTNANGLFVYDPESDEMRHYTYRPDGLNRISSNCLGHIMEDRSGSIWVSGGTSGLVHLSVLANGASYIYPEDDKLINQETTIRTVTHMKDGAIWVSNFKGHIYKYEVSLQQKPRIDNYSVGIYKILEDETGKLWLGSRGEGLCVDGTWYKHQAGDTCSLAHNRVFDIFSDYRQRIWIATFGGGLDLAVPSEDGRSYTFRHFLQGNTVQQEIRVITSDANNWMWVGTDDGICVFHPDSLIENPGKYYRYTYQNNYLPAGEVKTILYDSKKRIWIGTTGGGVSWCIPEGNYADLHFTHLTASDGLINNLLRSINEDQEGKLWLATQYGISRFTPETGRFENFLFDHSISGNIYNENSTCRLPDGRLLFGTDHGVAIIDPAKIETNHRIPTVCFTDLKLNGITISPREEGSPLDHALGYTKELRLKYYQNSFVAEFSSLDYNTLNGTKYTYMLDGYDTEWSTASSLNFAAYKNIPPGRYILHVKACNAVGTWSDEEASLLVIIGSPVWKTTWAYFLYLLLALSLVYVGLRIITKFSNLRNRIQIEKQLTEYKLVFFTNISHEFRTPLTLIQGALEKLETEKNLSEETAYSTQIIRKSTQRLLRLINQLLEFRKMQHNKLVLSLEETESIAFLQNIFESFKYTAENKNIVFKFVPEVEAYRMFVDKEKLDKIIYNLLSNAFKYTPTGGKITLSVSVNENTKRLVIKVIDTGIGISKEKQVLLFSRFMQSNFSDDSMGIGLHLTHELVTIHQGIITYNENEKGGSVFTVLLPLDNSVYTEKDFLPTSSLQGDLLRDEPIISSSIVAEDVPVSTSLNQKKILIIEDDTDIRNFLENEISIYFEVVSETDGVSGLERAQSFDADLIICDVLMPGMNGYEVTRRLKDDFNTSHIPIILLTAMSTAENELEGTESGADAYITKPFSPKLLLARIFQLIKQRDKLREKFSNDPYIELPATCSSDKDKEFLNKLNLIIKERMSDSGLSVDELAGEVNLGRTIFYRKVRGVTGYSPNEYIRIIRMKKAAGLLLQGNYNVSEVSYRVGIENPIYFSKYFKEQFGVLPSTYLRTNKKKDNQ